MNERVVFERSTSWLGRYRVEARGEGVSWLKPYDWQLDRIYDKKTSAIARAESLIHKSGVDDVRVVDTKETS